jgi:hypothetical protein
MTPLMIPHQASRNLEAQRAIAAAEQLLLEQVRSPLIALDFSRRAAPPRAGAISLDGP